MSESEHHSAQDERRPIRELVDDRLLDELLAGPVTRPAGCA
nr:hypothetical protein [Actinomadura bangladeshensis]